MMCRISYVQQHLGLSDKNIQHTPFPRASATFFVFLPIIDRSVDLYTSCLGSDIALDLKVGSGLCELIGVRLD